MATDEHEQKPSEFVFNTPIDVRGAARAALGSAVVAGLVGGGLYILGKLTESYVTRIAEEQAQRDEAPTIETDATAETDDADAEMAHGHSVAEAAVLLGVDVDATADEVRAALRAKLGASRLHPDQGGDAIRARELIDAKNLLISKLREVES